MKRPSVFSFDEHVPMLAATRKLGELADHVEVTLPTLVDRIKAIGEPHPERVAA